MLIIRPTMSLAKRMNIRLEEASDKSTTRLGDWYSTDLNLGPRRYILCVSEKARISLIVNAAPYSDFPLKLIRDLPSLLRKIGVSELKVAEEIKEMDPIQIAKTDSRSVLRNMKEFKEALKCEHQIGRFDHSDLIRQSFWMSDTITFAIPEHSPVDAARSLFGMPRMPRLRVV